MTLGVTYYSKCRFRLMYVGPIRWSWAIQITLEFNLQTIFSKGYYLATNQGEQDQQAK